MRLPALTTDECLRIIHRLGSSYRALPGSSAITRPVTLLALGVQGEGTTDHGLRASPDSTHPHTRII